MCSTRLLALAVALLFPAANCFAIAGEEVPLGSSPNAVDGQESNLATPVVILVSIDGYRADYLERGLNPVLEALAADGVRAQWLTPSFPTVTEPNHYTAHGALS